MRTIARLERRLALIVVELEKKYVGRDVTIAVGKFAGRRARVTSVIISDQGAGYRPAFMVQPYYLRRGHSCGELMWEDSLARTYHARAYFRMEGEKNVSY